MGLGVALGVAQIGWQLAPGKADRNHGVAQSFLGDGLGRGTLITKDPRFVMIKPSLIYVIVAVVMLKPGWMNRYLPPAAVAVVPDIALIFGFVWAGLMFFLRGAECNRRPNFSVVAWSSFMSVYAIVSKARPVPHSVCHHALHRRPSPPRSNVTGTAIIVRGTSSRKPGNRLEALAGDRQGQC